VLVRRGRQIADGGWFDVYTGGEGGEGGRTRPGGIALAGEAGIRCRVRRGVSIFVGAGGKAVRGRGAVASQARYTIIDDTS
jgi:hypothetical protein